jgi:TolB-like protein
LAIVGAIALAAWQTVQHRQRLASTPDPVLAMPSGPVIAVLPFTNMSGDPAQDYFSDGLTEDILQSWRFAISCSQQLDLPTRAKLWTSSTLGEAGRAAVEGSVRKSSQQAMTAQLIDACRSHIWAEKYDRHPLTLHRSDEIASKIVAAITGVTTAHRTCGTGSRLRKSLAVRRRPVLCQRVRSWSKEN